MKHSSKIIAFLLSLVLVLGIFSPTVANAAATPDIRATTEGMTLIKGSSEDMMFTISRAYAQEKYYIAVYAPSGLEVAYAQGEVISETVNVDLAIPVNDALLDLNGGKYTVEFYLSYYANSKWNNTDVKTTYFYVLEDTCKGNHSFGKAQTVVAPTCSRTGKGKVTCSKCTYVTFTELSPKHTYSDASDQKCNICGWTRQAPTLINENGTWKYYVDGFFTEATLLVKYNSAWYYVKNGILAHTYTGLVKHSGAWYYVRNGKLDSTATTLVKYNGEWFYVVNGKVASGTTGLVKYNGEWWYVVKGKVASKTTTLVNHWGGWYYILKGKLAAKTTTLVKHNGIWYYVKNGQVDFGYSGTFYYNYKNYTVKNGRVV